MHDGCIYASLLWVLENSKQRIMKVEVSFCKLSKGKLVYSSEAKANRALHRYKDIKRYYYCTKCEGYHTTSMDFITALERGLDVAVEPKDVVDLNYVAARIQELELKVAS